MSHTCIYEGTKLRVYYRVAMDIEVYTSGDVYMESILVYCFHCVLIYLLWGWAVMNLPAGMLTTNA